jgi:glutamine amidotransferase
MNDLRFIVIDYGAGNLRSVVKALERFGITPLVSKDPQDVQQADALVLPGQGACDSAMLALSQHGLTEAVQEAIGRGIPFLGICVGLQLLFDTSEEGGVNCLGIIPGQVRRLPPNLKIPHMGWNTVHFETDHPIFTGIPQDSHFYFAHSYYVEPISDSFIAGTTSYGISFCSAVAYKNLAATQFHPEKSSTWGLKIYENFLAFAEQPNEPKTSTTPEAPLLVDEHP